MDSDNPYGKSQLRNVLMEPVFCFVLFCFSKLNNNWWTGGKWRQEDPLGGCNDPRVRDHCTGAVAVGQT